MNFLFVLLSTLSSGSGKGSDAVGWMTSAWVKLTVLEGKAFRRPFTTVSRCLTNRINVHPVSWTQDGCCNPLAKQRRVLLLTRLLTLHWPSVHFVFNIRKRLEFQLNCIWVLRNFAEKACSWFQKNIYLDNTQVYCRKRRQCLTKLKFFLDKLSFQNWNCRFILNYYFHLF